MTTCSNWASRSPHEYGLAVRASDRAAQQRLKNEGLPANDHPLLDSFSLDLDAKSTRYAEMLRALPLGLTQSAQAHEIAAQESIVLMDYLPVQQLWRGNA